jgi:hypothetical protein
MVPPGGVGIKRREKNHVWQMRRTADGRRYAQMDGKVSLFLSLGALAV